MRGGALVLVLVLAIASCNQSGGRGGAPGGGAPGGGAPVGSSAGSGALAAPAPSEAAYARLLIAAIEKTGAAHDLRFDPGGRLIIGAGGYRISTANVYAEWRALPADERDAALARVARTFASTQGPKADALDDVRAQVLPVVRSLPSFSTRRFKVAAGDKPLPEIPYTPLGAAAGVGLGIDGDASIRIVTTDDLARWKVPLARLQAVAIANLRAKGPAFEQLEPGVWASQTHDGYDSSRVLLVDEIRRLGLRGGAVALMPSRDLLLLAGAKDPHALLAIADRADAAASGPWPVHTIPMCLGAAGWAECAPAVTPVVRARYHELALVGWASIYDDQKDALQAEVGDDTFVAALNVVRDKASTEVASYAVWSRTVPTLLPHADLVVFMDVSEDEKATLIGIVPWDRVMAVCGAHLRPDGRVPPRWSTGDWFPSAADLARMRPSQDPFGR